MNDVDLIFTLDRVRPRIWGVEIETEISWQVRRGEQWAVVGNNGAGKTILADLICGRHAVCGGSLKYDFFERKKREESKPKYPTELIKKMSFESAYMIADYKNMYFQQRFHALENESSPTVGSIVGSVGLPQTEKDYICEKLNLKPLLEKHLIMLSSGELRRFLLANVLMQKPEVLILDNPFIGLDVETRKNLDSFFSELALSQTMIFLVPALNEIPTCVSHILPVENLHYGKPVSKKDFLSSEQTCLVHKNVLPPVCALPSSVVSQFDYEYVFKMKNINVKYSNRQVFKNLDWELKRGEKWALLGPNGAGKSTLLSLVAADNPKAYSMDITIFDRKRGTGESIWDIKHRIGYISSEMHLYFREDQPCLRIVASGFFDTIGLFRKATPEQERVAMEWMKLLGIEYLADRSFLKISNGEQRLVLFVRTVVKNPDLLILDEPLHGLDMPNKKRVREIIETFCAQKEKSMIYVTHRKEEIPSCVMKTFELERHD